jgi:predicted glycoside hydrolase/deacetylase ChbG (UPF0249 family)
MNAPRDDCNAAQSKKTPALVVGVFLLLIRGTPQGATHVLAARAFHYGE